MFTGPGVSAFALSSPRAAILGFLVPILFSPRTVSSAAFYRRVIFRIVYRVELDWNVTWACQVLNVWVAVLTYQRFQRESEPNSTSCLAFGGSPRESRLPSFAQGG